MSDLGQLHVPPQSGSSGAPHRADVVVTAATLTGGTWALVFVSSRLTTSNNSIADGDWSEWDVWVDAGTWRIDFSCLTSGSSGVVQWSLDGVDVGATIDNYSASTVTDVQKAVTDITVTEAGVYPLRVRLSGKNASSSGYRFYLQALAMRRTGA